MTTQKGTGDGSGGSGFSIASCRQWSLLLAEQVIGWGIITAGSIALVAPNWIASPIIANNPIAFIAGGLGILGGKNVLDFLKGNHKT